jgi:hypothetical protein
MGLLGISGWLSLLLWSWYTGGSLEHGLNFLQGGTLCMLCPGFLIPPGSWYFVPLRGTFFHIRDKSACAHAIESWLLGWICVILALIKWGHFLIKSGYGYVTEPPKGGSSPGSLL